MKKIVCFFCMDERVDPVAPGVFAAVEKRRAPTPIGLEADGLPVLELADNSLLHFVRLRDVLSHDYRRYLPLLRTHFADYDLACVVNWHQGANAPDRVLTVHSTGDAPSGCFGPSDPRWFKSIARALEHSRVAHGLDDFRVTTEATHWSGIPYDQQPERIAEYPVPVYDVEIGSTPESWSHPGAVEALADALCGLVLDEAPLKALVCVGGVHFEECFAQTMLDDAHPLGIGHILANQWVVDQYVEEVGARKLAACMDSVLGGVRGVIFHDNLKSAYKQLCRDTAERYGAFAGKHKLLRTPEELMRAL